MHLIGTWLRCCAAQTPWRYPDVTFMGVVGGPCTFCKVTYVTARLSVLGGCVAAPPLYLISHFKMAGYSCRLQPSLTRCCKTHMDQTDSSWPRWMRSEQPSCLGLGSRLCACCQAGDGPLAWGNRPGYTHTAFWHGRLSAPGEGKATSDPFTQS